MFIATLQIVTFTFLLIVFIKRKIKKQITRRKEQLKQNPNTVSIGFLHPHALSGGGGERVLWCAIQAVQQELPDAQIIIYSAWESSMIGNVSDSVNVAQNRVSAQFGLNLDNIYFHPIDISSDVSLIDPNRYPRLTLIRQAIGAAHLGAIAYYKHPVDVFVDTANLSFSVVIPKLLFARTLSYVHYPTISTDMLAVVRSRQAQFNNTSTIASSRLLTFGKLLYYWIFAVLYAISAQCIDVVAANSSWTRTHLETIWRRKHIPTVYPPCSIRIVAGQQQSRRTKSLLVSIGQFRPEKNHMLQLETIAYLCRHYAQLKVRLAMIGGTRNEEDEQRVKILKEEIKRRELPVDIYVNASREQLQELLQDACIGVHTMRDEHFGISVVELQAAGVVVVAHNSGGVAMDIIQDGSSGFLADGSPELFGETIAKVINMGDTERERIVEAGIEGCGRYSENAFRTRFRGLIDLCVGNNR